MLHDFKSRSQWAGFNTLLAILAGFFFAGLLIFVFQHWMHVWFWLPYALVLVCPLMMLFMMRGMQR